MVGKRGSLTFRFWPKVNKTETCWLWTANKNNQGYGLIYSLEADRKLLAHRVSWELANGPIPEGMCVLHQCDVPLCVNPSHLFLGTLAENMIDKERKGRSGRDAEWLAEVRRRGQELKTDKAWLEKNNAAAKKRRKLSEQQEDDVRRLRKNGESIRALSRIFEIDRTSITRILQEKSSF